MPHSLPGPPRPSIRQAETCWCREPAPTPGAVSVTQRGLERDMGNHRAVCLSSRASQRSFILGQLAQEEQQLGSLSFKGRTQCKSWSSLDAAGRPELSIRYQAITAGCTPLAKKARQRSRPPATRTAIKSNIFYSTLQLGRGVAPGASAGGVWRVLGEVSSAGLRLLAELVCVGQLTG